MLVVLVIMGMILVLSSGMTRRTRDTFVSQQYIKTALQDSRILRRKSMLITRNSSETQWVHGIGFWLARNAEGNWVMTQIKALDSSTNGYFYKSYPKMISCIDTSELDGSAGGSCALHLKKIDNTQESILPSGLTVQVRLRTRSDPADVATQPACFTSSQAVTVIYESINGTMHVYCKIGGLDYIVNETDPSIDLKIKYADDTFYKYEVNLLSDGEINAITF